MNFFILIMALSLGLVKVLEAKAKNEKNESMEKIAKNMKYMLGTSISFISNLMAGLSFSAAFKSIVPIIILILIKIGIAIYAQIRKIPKLKWIMLVLLISDIIALYMYIYVYSN